MLAEAPALSVCAVFYVQLCCLLDLLPCRNCNSVTVAIDEGTKLSRSQHSLWEILHKYCVTYLGVCFVRARVREDTRSSNSDGRKYRETNCGQRILYRENGAAGTCKIRRENHIKWSLLMELLYIICVNQRLQGFLQFLSGFLMQADGIHTEGKVLD